MTDCSMAHVLLSRPTVIPTNSRACPELAEGRNLVFRSVRLWLGHVPRSALLRRRMAHPAEAEEVGRAGEAAGAGEVGGAGGEGSCKI
jgi:hypothetical protein